MEIMHWFRYTCESLNAAVAAIAAIASRCIHLIEHILNIVAKFAFLIRDTISIQFVSHRKSTGAHKPLSVLSRQANTPQKYYSRLHIFDQFIYNLEFFPRTAHCIQIKWLPPNLPDRPLLHVNDPILPPRSRIKRKK